MPDQHLLNTIPFARKINRWALLNIPLQRRFGAPTLCCRRQLDSAPCWLTKQRFEFISLNPNSARLHGPSGVTLSMGMGLSMAFFQSANAMVSRVVTSSGFLDSPWHTNTRRDTQPTNNKLSAV